MSGIIAMGDSAQRTNTVVSVLISTFNRWARLEQALHSLANTTVPPHSNLEVIVVDNNSSDKTSEVVARFAAQRPDVFRYVLERRQGKSFALNTGLRHARGDIIAFTDDDCVIPRDWVEALVRAFSRQPPLDGLGGRVMLHDPLDRPVAVRTSEIAAVLEAKWFNPAFIPILGCNMAYRRHVVDTVGPFDTTLGPGATIDTAEDVDFIYRVLREEFTIGYEPSVTLSHNHGRRSDAMVESARRGYTIGRGAFYCKHIRSGDVLALRLAFREARELASAVVRRPAGTRSPWRATGLLMAGAWRSLLSVVA